MKRKYEVIGIVIDTEKKQKNVHFYPLYWIVKLKTLQKLLIFFGADCPKTKLGSHPQT